MTADQFLLALSKYWRGIVVITAIGILGALGFAATQPVLYESSSTIYVSAAASGSRGGLIQSSHYVDTAVQSLARIGSSTTVLRPVIATLRLRTTAPELARRVSVDVGTNTVVLTVRALAATPAGSVRLVDAVRSSLAKQQAVVATRVPAGAGLVPALTLHTVTPPRQPSAPASPNLRLILATGALVGLLLGLLFAVARQLIRTTIASVAEVRGVPATRSVAFLGSVAPEPADRIEATDGPSDEYRTIALHLRLLNDGPRTLVVASAGAGASTGAAPVARRIAQSAAERSQRVLLVDADLRRPVTERPVIGLAEVLQGASSLDEALQRGGTMTVLSAGSPSVDPGALLGSEAVRRLVGQLAERFDLVVLAAPAVLDGPDTLELAALADGTVLVVRGGVTRAVQLRRSVESTRMAGVALAGIVFERPRRRNRRSATGGSTPVASPDSADDRPQAAASRAAPADTQPVSTR